MLCLGVIWYGRGGILGVSLPTRRFVPKMRGPVVHSVVSLMSSLGSFR